ncbi:hypothetical protein CC99x_002485 [Candidatus Berkiella cookevillensis]|uniref:Uncharacterized protein n=1 Tax=Candidatus Berkiella cookevillensis TaxID=437022 RepID=A0A0Q9YLI6_9GAMM|nr:hypothetical protein [Candidatus Berkiella cookevillensis]MCS5707767.1 hypothetical protein [Candidatus Berkiella cookevillensis]
MLDFFKTKAFHDTCENYCPDAVYDYLRGQGWWEHLFYKDFSEQLMDYVRENPATSALVAATLIGSTVVGSAFAVQKIKAKTASDLNVADEIKVVSEDENSVLGDLDHTDTGTGSSVEEEQEMKDPIVQPKKLPVATILSKVFDYLKANTGEHHSSIADALGISQENVARLKQLPGFPKSKVLYGQQVIQRSAADALALLGLPRDGSYPKDDAHYLALAEAIGMPSPKEDNGARVKVTF